MEQFDLYMDIFDLEARCGKFLRRFVCLIESETCDVPTRIQERAAENAGAE
jgi:hypothetical protein